MNKGLAELLSDLAPDADTGGMLGLDRQADAALVRLARGGGAIDLAIGQALVALGEGDRLLELGFSRMVDYARESLGVSTASGICSAGSGSGDPGTGWAVAQSAFDGVRPAFAKASAGASLLRRPAILSASLFRPPSVWPAEACAP
jgi:hypothetical protein